MSEKAVRRYPSGLPLTVISEAIVLRISGNCSDPVRTKRPESIVSQLPMLLNKPRKNGVMYYLLLIHQQ